MSAFEELKGKLREIFQLDRNDLDFGLYRIMNLKAEEINSFLENDLLPQIKDGLKSYVSKDNALVKEELDKAIQAAESLGIEPDRLPKVKELKVKLANSFDVEKVENEIYSDLYNFFKRYYSEGDFLSLRRYKEGVYALPYEGEEVKLHWANADQYYIKSGETLTNYTFKAGDKKVRFEVISANTEQNNNKDDKNRRFKLLEEHPVRFENNEFVISFSYLPEEGAPKQEELNKKAADVLLHNSDLLPIVNDLNKLTGTEKNRITTILKHLNNFTAKNTFDYFIHKDLGKFLRRELDFFIKNEIMHLDDIDSDEAPRVEQYLGKIKVLRKVANKIITFLAQLEDFQKKIWLKKKFVLETNYCITLDRVPEKLYPIITTNEKQKEEWKKLFAIGEIKGFNGNITEEFLKQNPYLVLDTQFFDNDFKYKLLSSIDNFDEQCDGLLIHSENFQALNLLQEKYAEQIKCIYTDPPYNTAASEIAYKNEYKHSSWISLLNDRIVLSKEFLADEGVLGIAIDDEEENKLNLLLSHVYGNENKLGQIVVVQNPGGRHDDKFIATAHEYCIYYGKNIDYTETNLLPLEDKDINSFKFQDDEGAYRTREFRRSGNNSTREARPKMYYPILIKDNLIKLVKDEEYRLIHTKQGFNESYLQSLIRQYECEGYDVVLPIDPNGIHRVWRWGPETLSKQLNNVSVDKKEGKYILKVKDRLENKVGLKPKSVWYKPQYAGAVGTKWLKDLNLDGIFSYPKSLYTVIDSLRIGSDYNCTILDYFAGSGTTGHAVINLNREDNGNRKYILVEMGNYFDLVTKPRIEKVIYSEDWKDGKPVSRKGSSHCFKYIRLESYEDALDNLKFETTKQRTDLLSLANNKSIKEEYMLNYMMDIETKGSLLNISNFNHPFDYEMKITRDGETKTVKVDLVETFNYLIGLNVKTIEEVRGVLAISGKTRTGEKTLVLWRNTDEVDNATLDAWFKKEDYSTQDMEFDTIYVNGNNNLENLKKGDETWKVRLIEDEFGKRMFDVQDV